MKIHYVTGRGKPGRPKGIAEREPPPAVVVFATAVRPANNHAGHDVRPEGQHARCWSCWEKIYDRPVAP